MRQLEFGGGNRLGRSALGNSRPASESLSVAYGEERLITLGLLAGRTTAVLKKEMLDLVDAVMRDPFEGPGKPEPLK